MNALALSFHNKDHYSQFVSTLAHETRNPLANISLSAEMLQTTLTDAARGLYCDIIIRNAKRINELVVELLTYQKEEELQVEELSLSFLVGEALILTGDRIRLKNINVTEEYDAEEYRVSLNGPKMKMALTNIIINAVEAMVKDEGVLKIAIKTAYGKYILQIEDNGCGISKEHLPRLFTTAFTTKPGGLGLGLPIIYDTLRANNVSVNVESEEGKGTLFTLLFDRK